MTVQNVIDMAVSSELKNIAVKDDTTSILNYINLGMIELYKRFPLKVEEWLVTLGDGVIEYTAPGDLMWIVAAYGEVDEYDTGNTVITQLPINDEDNILSVNTISWNKVQIPGSISGSYVSIIYVASPVYITEADLVNEIELPAQLIEALLHYVGYRAHAAMDGNIQAENSTHYSRFEASCKRVESTGMFTSDTLDMSDRNLKGFV